MAKDPAFLFYTSDFLTGTMLMTDEQVGKYIRLLCLQHQKGRLSEKHMLSVCKTYDEDIYEKFTKDDEYKYYNSRLEDESIKRSKFAQSRRDNAKGKRKPIKKLKKAYAQHMEDVNENENINKDRIIIFPFDSKKFKDYWNIWKEYKSTEHKFKYKSEISEQSALKKLSTLANVNEDTAIKILEDAMANGYKGFFEIKTNKNGNHKEETINAVATAIQKLQSNED